MGFVFVWLLQTAMLDKPCCAASRPFFREKKYMSLLLCFSTSNLKLSQAAHYEFFWGRLVPFQAGKWLPDTARCHISFLDFLLFHCNKTARRRSYAIP